MYCNSKSVNKPSHPSLPTLQFDKIWHVHYLNAYAFSSLYLKMFFFIIAGQTIKIQVYLKNSNERKKKALVPTFHTLSSLLNALNSFVWTFCIVSSLAHIIIGSKHAGTHTRTPTQHSHTCTYTLSLTTMVVVLSTYLVLVSPVSILCA